MNLYFRLNMTSFFIFLGLCDGCLIDQGVGFNPYPGDCTKFVQCWKQGDTIMSLVRSCPFGQFWDADAITCRPSFLVLCTAGKYI